MSLRDWLILIGILVIVGVLADGYRRMRLARKRSSEISFGLEEVKGYDDDFSSELPNGGARPSALKESSLKDSILKEGFAKKEPAKTRVEPGFSGGDYFDGYPEAGIEESPVYSESLGHRHRHPEETERHVEESSARDSAAGEKAREQRTLDLDEPVPVLMNLDESQQSSRSKPSRRKRLSSSEKNLHSGGFSRAAGADRSVRSRETSRLDAEPGEFVGHPRVASSQGKAPIQERDVSARESSNPQKELNLGGGGEGGEVARPPARQ